MQWARQDNKVHTHTQTVLGWTECLSRVCRAQVRELVFFSSILTFYTAVLPAGHSHISV